MAVIGNLGDAPVPLPGGAVLVESVPGAAHGGVLAPDAAVWLQH